MSSQSTSPPYEPGPLWKDSPPLFYWSMSYAPLETRLAGIRAALAAGADPNELDTTNSLIVGRPLHYAICDMPMVDTNQLKQNLPIVEALLEAGADPRLINRQPIFRSPIDELERWFWAYETYHETMSKEGLYDFYEKSLKAMKKVAERLDAEEAAEAARKAESERSWLSKLRFW